MLVTLTKILTTFTLQKVSEPNFENISLHSDGSHMKKASAELANTKSSSKSLAADSGTKILVASGPSPINPIASGIHDYFYCIFQLNVTNKIPMLKISMNTI